MPFRFETMRIDPLSLSPATMPLAETFGRPEGSFIPELLISRVMMFSARCTSAMASDLRSSRERTLKPLASRLADSPMIVMVMVIAMISSISENPASFCEHLVCIGLGLYLLDLLEGVTARRQ